MKQFKIKIFHFLRKKYLRFHWIANVLCIGEFVLDNKVEWRRLDFFCISFNDRARCSWRFIPSTSLRESFLATPNSVARVPATSLQAPKETVVVFVKYVSQIVALDNRRRLRGRFKFTQRPRHSLSLRFLALIQFVN